MDPVLNDERFAHIATDVRFRSVPKHEQKVKIDKRFQSMFSGNNFKVKYSVDKRGRPNRYTTDENLKKYYDLSSSSGSEDSDVEKSAGKSKKKSRESKAKPKADGTLVSEVKSKKKSRESKAKPEADETSASEGKSKKKSRELKAKPEADETSASEGKSKKKSSESKAKPEADKTLVSEAKSKKISRKSKAEPKADETLVSEAKGKKISRKSKAEPKEDETSDSEVKSKTKSRKSKAKPESDESSDSDVEGGVVQEEKKLDMDYARGEGALETSSSEEDSSDSDEEDQEDSEIIHPWDEPDRGDVNAETVVTRRFAVCNVDWDRITAQDIYVLLNSFTPAGGLIKSVKVYLSDIGRQRLQEEDVTGPKELLSDKPVCDEDETRKESREGKKYHMEKLRAYQLKRLEYFYAVVECDSATTANIICDACQGCSYESSAPRLDLSYIRDDEKFDQEPHSMADVSSNTGQYRPKFFSTTALQQTKVECTWDETNPDRLQVFERAFNKGEEENMEIRAYLADFEDSEDEDAEAIKGSKSKNVAEKDEESGDSENDDGIHKYKTLLKEIEESENNKKDFKGDVYMEITWGTGLKEKTESIIKNKMSPEDTTPWQQYLSQKKEKKRQKREDKKKEKDQNEHGDGPRSDDGAPSDLGFDDPFFKEDIVEESAVKDNSKKCKKKSKKKTEDVEDDEDAKQKNAELELLMMEEGSGLKHHYNLDKLLKSKTKTKSKKSEEKDNFQIDVDDPRFSAIFSSHAYNIDPSDPNLKRTEGMEALLREKQKRKLKIEDASVAKPPTGKRQKTSDNPILESRVNEPLEVSGRSSKSAELSMLIKSVKNKACNFKRKNKRVS